MKKLGVVLSCYDKTDDLLAHLDILSFNPHKYPLIIGYMGKDQCPHEFRQHNLLAFESPGFTSGTLVTLVHALRLAPKLDLDYLVFRNSDDWFFNHDLTQQWFEHLVKNNYLCAGYNWFSVGTHHDITMNEVFVSVPEFSATMDKAEKYILESDQRFNCEYKMAWWMRQTLENPDRQFYRLPDREQEPGIGWEVQDIPGVYANRGQEVPTELWTKLEHNNRFFNKKWQMIGSHQNMARYLYYRQIRDDIPYSAELERKYHFNRWMRAALTRGRWNSETYNKSRCERLHRETYPIRTENPLPRKLLRSKMLKKQDQ